MDEAWGVAGADTHNDSITFAIIDSTGADLALRSFEVASEGVAEILTWLRNSNLKVTAAEARPGRVVIRPLVRSPLRRL